MRTSSAMDRGQTAAEYLGIIVVVGLVLGVLATTDIGADIRRWLGDAIASVVTNVGGAGG